MADDPFISTAITIAQPQRLVKPKLLLGEGRDEEAFFGALLAHLGIGDVQVIQYGGKSKLPDFLDTLPLLPGFRNAVSLGITRDADTDAHGAFQSVCASLTRNGVAAPSAPGEIAAGNPNVGVMILPHGVDSGMLEDVCLAAVVSDAAMPCVDQYFTCVSSVTTRAPRNIAKARVRVWLASQETSDDSLGIAATKGYFDWSNSAFEPLKKFIRAL